MLRVKDSAVCISLWRGHFGKPLNTGLLKTTLKCLFSESPWGFSTNPGRQVSYQGLQPPQPAHRTPNIMWVAYPKWWLSEPPNHKFGESSILSSRGNGIYKIRFKKILKTQVSFVSKCLSQSAYTFHTHSTQFPMANWQRKKKFKPGLQMAVHDMVLPVKIEGLWPSSFGQWRIEILLVGITLTSPSHSPFAKKERWTSMQICINSSAEVKGFITRSGTLKEEQSTKGSAAGAFGRMYVNEYLGMTPESEKMCVPCESPSNTFCSRRYFE